MFRSTGISLCCLALLGCQTPRMMFYDDGATMQRQVAELVPPGTPLADAKKTMKDNGFNCSERMPPKHKPADGSEAPAEEPYLICQYNQMTGIFGNYQLDVRFPCTEEGCVGEPGIDKLRASPGLCPKDHPASDPPCPIEPAPLWTKVVAGTAMAALIIITVPIACLALGHCGGGCCH
jgi:hypothetical protein